MTETVNLYNAKTHLSELVDRAVGGEDIVIAKSGKPQVRLVPVRTPEIQRRPGRLKGQLRIGDDFDAPLPDDLSAAFQGRRP